MKKEIKILAIETSCDETAAAIVGVKNNRPKILSNIISSQINLHAKTGGVVPEVASRAHMEAIIPVIKEALGEANTKTKYRNPKQIESNLNSKNLRHISNSDFGASDWLSDITHVAVTAGPGLIGSLLVGFNTAKAIAYSKDLPLIPINHIEGHIYSAFTELDSKSEIRNPKQSLNSNNQNSKDVFCLGSKVVNFPILALTVSGGHTSLTLMKNHGKYQTLGETLDDAAGEAFDKVAKLLGLGYPGGPIVSKFATECRNKVKSQKSARSKIQGIEFPRPLLKQPNFDFSFSGLKTAVLTEVLKLKAKNSKLSEGGSLSNKLTVFQKEEICFAFEEATVDVLTTKTMRAAQEFRPKGIILAGGVAANRRLREELKNRIEKYNSEAEESYKMNFYLPGPGMSGDNAAMIGLAAYWHIITGESKKIFETKVDSNLALVDF